MIIIMILDWISIALFITARISMTLLKQPNLSVSLLTVLAGRSFTVIHSLSQSSTEAGASSTGHILCPIHSTCPLTWPVHVSTDRGPDDKKMYLKKCNLYFQLRTNSYLQGQPKPRGPIGVCSEAHCAIREPKGWGPDEDWGPDVVLFYLFN